jgi:hypothetical protein
MIAAGKVTFTGWPETSILVVDRPTDALNLSEKS